VKSTEDSYDIWLLRKKELETGNKFEKKHYDIKKSDRKEIEKQENRDKAEC